MTGTGTQADPLRPTNWQEFIEAVGTSGAYVSCPADEVWDMNEIDSAGITATTPWNALAVEGNKLKIKNLAFKSNILFSGIDGQYVHKLNFLNMYDYGESSSTYAFMSESSRVKFQNCEMAGQFSRMRAFESIYFTHDDEKSCTITLNLLGTADFARSCILLGCLINLSGNSSATHDYRTPINASYCKFIGQNPFNKMILNYARRGNVIDMMFPEGKNLSYDYNSSTPCVAIFNSEKMFGTYTKNYFVPVTPDKFTDIPYLQSIGFPVVS